MNLSRHLSRDMMRRAIQWAGAACATYLIMSILGLEETYLAILSAVLIITPSVGGTMGAALTRIQATLVGSIISLGCLALLPDGWSTPLALALSVLVVGGLTGIRPDWSYGAVAAIGIALPSEAGFLETATTRGLAIAIGAATGVLVSLLLWPERAEARFERHFRTALRATARHVRDSLEAAAAKREDAAPPDHDADYHNAIQAAQDALGVVKLVDRTGMKRRLDALRRLYNSVIILDRAAAADIVLSFANARLVDQIDALRRDVCAVLIALAEGRDESAGRTGHINDMLKGLQATMSEDEPTAEVHRNRDALSFGLNEVRQALAGMIKVTNR